MKDVLQRYATEILPTKRSEQSDRSRIKTLTEAFGDFRLASLSSTQIATGHKTLDMLKRYTHLRAEDLAKKLK